MVYDAPQLSHSWRVDAFFSQLDPAFADGIGDTDINIVAGTTSHAFRAKPASNMAVMREKFLFRGCARTRYNPHITLQGQ